MEEYLHEEKARPHGENQSLKSLPTDFETPSFQNVGDVVGAVLRLYRDNFLSLVKIVSVLTIPLIVAQHVFLNLFQFPFAEVTLTLSTLIGKSLMSGALIYAVVVFKRAGAFPTLADSYRWGFKRWGRVLLCSFLYVLIIVLGCMALIIPGIIFSLMFALVVPIAVIEDRATTQSFNRSSRLTKNYRWQIFLTYFVFSFIIIIISFITTAGLGDETAAASSLPFALVQGLTAQLLESSSTVLTLFIYLGILKDLKQLSPPGRDDASAPPLRDDRTRHSQVETGHEF